MLSGEAFYLQSLGRNLVLLSRPQAENMEPHIHNNSRFYDVSGLSRGIFTIYKKIFDRRNIKKMLSISQISTNNHLSFNLKLINCGAALTSSIGPHFNIKDNHLMIHLQFSLTVPVSNLRWAPSAPPLPPLHPLHPIILQVERALPSSSPVS